MPTRQPRINVGLIVLFITVFATGLFPHTIHSQEGDGISETSLVELCGDYEFDLTNSGSETFVIRFSSKDGALWFQTTSSSEPGRLESPVSDAMIFTRRDSSKGLYEIEFVRDQGGDFNLVRLKNDTLGIDVTGQRLAHPHNFPTLAERLSSREGLTETRNDLKGTRVAVYFGRGMDGHSTLALGRAFQWMGCDVELIDGAAIRSGLLDRFDVIAFPGGETDPDPWNDLGPEGKAAIQKFVANGRGYVGICLGALLAASSGDFWGGSVGEPDLFLDLFPGSAHCGQPRLAPKGSWPLMSDLEIPESDHPISAALPKEIRAVTYPNGPYFQPQEGADVSVVATFSVTGNPAMVAFEYGNGRVFLSGPHPEIEVDSDRDGSNNFDEMSDEGSEWPLLLAAMRWITARNPDGS